MQAERGEEWRDNSAVLTRPSEEVVIETTTGTFQPRLVSGDERKSTRLPDHRP